MVFDWFNRRPDQPETEGQAPSAPESSGESAESTDGQQSSSAPEHSSIEVADEEPVTGGEPDSLQTTEEDEALVWAREAYARLKAQQAATASQPEPSAAPEPSPTAEAEPLSTATDPPEPLVSPESDPVGVPSEFDSTVSTPDLEPMLPVDEPPVPAETTPKPEPAPSAASLSLLEMAAAQRQQRHEEQNARAAALTPVSTPAPRPTAAPIDAADPVLGAFDEDFTWSAEVLAAQGRKSDEVSLEEIDWLGRLRRGLEKTRQGFVTGLLENLGDDPLTPEVLDDLETLLLRADAGVQATDQVLGALRQRMNQDVVDPEEGIRFLKEQLRGLLDAPIEQSGLELLAPERGCLNIWLMVGVNGVGKTTTLGKLANLAVRSGYSALIAAADTFRAAAVQQVQVWGERSDVPVVSNPSDNADPAAVVFDAIGAARTRSTDLLLVDTAGRLQTKHNLMEELQKVRKIIDRLAPEAKVESLLVLDASQGQNGLRQAMAFAQAAGLTGVVITKLDGTARGGVALAVSSEAGLPIRFIGAGEGLRDLRPFNSFEFVEALLAGR